MAFGGLGIFHVPDAGVGNCGLSVEHQADRLHRFDRERLMSFNQRALMCEIVHPHRVSGVEGPPERSEHLESHPSSAIARCAYHEGDPFILAFGCASEPPQVSHGVP